MQAPLDEADLTRIDELLADRLQHKIARRFEQARRCLAARYLPTYLLAHLLTYSPAYLLTDLLRCSLATLLRTAHLLLTAHLILTAHLLLPPPCITGGRLPGGAAWRLRRLRQ